MGMCLKGGTEWMGEKTTLQVTWSLEMQLCWEWGKLGRGILLFLGWAPLQQGCRGIRWHLHVSCLKISIQRGNISVGT